MRSPNVRTLISLALMVVTCTAARAQSTLGGGPSGRVAGAAKALEEGVSLLPADNPWKAPIWLGNTPGGSSSLGAGNDWPLGLIREGQALPNRFGAVQVTETREVLPIVARGSISSGAQGNSQVVPGGDKPNILPPKTALTPSKESPERMSHVSYWALQGLMFGSLAVAIEETHRCLNAGSCTAVPAQFQSRTAMISVGIPFAVGVSILSYEMKKHGNHWWYLPPAVIIGADTTLAVHGARASQ